MQQGGLRVHHVHSAEGIRTVRLVGELDSFEADHLRDQLADVNDDERLVVDTTELLFIDAAGLAVLVLKAKELGEDRFQLISGPATHRLLELSKELDLFGQSPIT